jgi:hypothetical protein
LKPGLCPGDGGGLGFGLGRVEGGLGFGDTLTGPVHLVYKLVLGSCCEGGGYQEAAGLRVLPAPEDHEACNVVGDRGGVLCAQHGGDAALGESRKRAGCEAEGEEEAAGVGVRGVCGRDAG